MSAFPGTGRDSRYLSVNVDVIHTYCGGPKSFNGVEGHSEWKIAFQGAITGRDETHTRVESRESRVVGQRQLLVVYSSNVLVVIVIGLRFNS